MGELVAGPDLDAAVAERVMGYLTSERTSKEFGAYKVWWPSTRGHRGRTVPPPYSTSIEAAWTVIEKLRAEGLVYFILAAEPDGTWEVEWTSHGSDHVDPRGIFASGATPAEAICRAAIALAGQALEAAQGASGVDSGHEGSETA